MSENEISLFETLESNKGKSKTVMWLDRTFSNEIERRAYFTAFMQKKLGEQDFRVIEGFPVGSDEDILAISDPPYYMACPNPFVNEFISFYGKVYDPNTPYERLPFAADVSEGKTHPLYGAMAYHTKVPHRAVMRYILHYTDPGDIVLDSFCGTGMAGVAAQMCADRDEVMALGYKVGPNDEIFREKPGAGGKKRWAAFSRLGLRRSVMVDLSPAATFIANTYNRPQDIILIEREANKAFDEMVKDWGWMYQTLRASNERATLDPERLAEELGGCKKVSDACSMFSRHAKSFGAINYTLWSDVYICPECSNEVILWEAAIDPGSASVLDEFPCPQCNAMLTKRRMERAWVTKYDKMVNRTVSIAKQVPVLINYSVGKKRYQKKVDAFDIALIEWIEKCDMPYWIPCDRMPEGFNTEQPRVSHGITNVHQFYHHRGLIALAALFDRSKGGPCAPIIFNMFTRINKQSSLHVSNYFKKGGGVCKGHLTGTLYIPSISPEIPVTKVFKDRLDTFLRGMRLLKLGQRESMVSTQSAHQLGLKDNTIDYIFLDPPFGANLNYSELNFIDESWLKVWTNVVPEAIENRVQGKGIDEYRHLMTACFKEAYRVLKPGRWMTVEFSNTKASVWNSIQTALAEAGFIVANVSVLDKKQGSFKAVTTPTAVKQDLVISAYKPNGGFEERFVAESSTEDGVWDFIKTHMKYLPAFKEQGDGLVSIPERDPRILFDQLVAYYVRKGLPLPMSSQEFQRGLAERFIERDGMYFMPEQAAEYDRKKANTQAPVQPSLFVSDESSAIQWLRNRLKRTPQRYNEIQPEFTPMLSHIAHPERSLLSLDILLDQNFICYDGKTEVPSQIHSYLSSNFKELRNLPKDASILRNKAKDRWYVPDPNKAGDLEKLRERALLKEFEEYRTTSQKRLKAFRLEAIRAGFKKAWQERDYATIIAVARKVPDNILQEDPKLLMWYDQAVTRIGGE